MQLSVTNVTCIWFRCGWMPWAAETGEKRGNPSLTPPGPPSCLLPADSNVAAGFTHLVMDALQQHVHVLWWPDGADHGWGQSIIQASAELLHSERAAQRPEHRLDLLISFIQQTAAGGLVNRVTNTAHGCWSSLDICSTIFSNQIIKVNKLHRTPTVAFFPFSYISNDIFQWQWPSDYYASSMMCPHSHDCRLCVIWQVVHFKNTSYFVDTACQQSIPTHVASFTKQTFIHTSKV